METRVGQRTNRNKKNDEESSCGGKTMPQHPVFCLIRHLLPYSPPLFSPLSQKGMMSYSKAIRNSNVSS